MDGLDELALAKAKVMYKKVHASKIQTQEIEEWSNEVLLSNSGVMIGDKLTRVAILFLGKELFSVLLRGKPI